MTTTNGTYPTENLEQYITPNTRYPAVSRKQLTALKLFVRNLNDGSKVQEAITRTHEELQDYGYSRFTVKEAVKPYMMKNKLSWRESSGRGTGKMQQSVLNVAREFYREPDLSWGQLKSKLGVE